MTNFFGSDEIADWQVEKTDFELIPQPSDELWDALFIVKALIIEEGKTEDCFIDVCIPERIAEYVFRLKNDELIIDQIIEKSLEIIPAVASDCFGQYDLYYTKSNPQIGIDILRNGLAKSRCTNVIAEDLGYILRDEGKIQEAVEAFKISEEFGPSSEYTYWELAGLYAELGQTAKEMEYRQKFKDNGGIELSDE